VNKNKDFEFATCLGISVSVGFLVIFATFLDGWALSSVWNWFIPTVFNLPVLTLWQAVGVGIVFQLFVHNKSNTDTKSKKEDSYWLIFLQSTIEIIVRNVLYVLVGWIIFQLAF